MKKFYSILAMAIFLPLGSVVASEDNPAPEALNGADWTQSQNTADSWQTTTTTYQSNAKSRSKPLSVGKRSANIAALRAEAMQISLRHLPRLRPYASNYPRMVRAVRAYWRNNTKNPSAARLTSTIMRHVKAKYRFFVRPKLRSGIAKGINVLRRKLRKS